MLSTYLPKLDLSSNISSLLRSSSCCICQQERLHLSHKDFISVRSSRAPLPAQAHWSRTLGQLTIEKNDQSRGRTVKAHFFVHCTVISVHYFYTSRSHQFVSLTGTLLNNDGKVLSGEVNELWRMISPAGKSVCSRTSFSGRTRSKWGGSILR